MEDAPHAEFSLQQVAEGAARIGSAVREEVGAAALAVVEGQEGGLHEVLHVDKGEGLRTVAHGKVNVLADAFGHKEIVAFARTVNARRTQDDVVQACDVGQRLFGLPFGLSVGRIGLRRVGVRDERIAIEALGLGGGWFGWRIGHCANNAQRTDKYEAAAQCSTLNEQTGQAQRSLRIDAAEVVSGATFCGTSGVDHVVPRAVCADMVVEGSRKGFVAAQVEVEETDAGILQVFSAARLSHSGPHLHTCVEGFLNQVTADEAAGSCDEDFHEGLLMSMRSATSPGSCIKRVADSWNFSALSVVR